MRRPSILDVVRAVTSTAPGHPEIESWWYAPPQRLRIGGDVAMPGQTFAIELVVEPEQGARVDRDRIAAEVAGFLRGASVTVRDYRGPSDDRHLFRLLRRRSPTAGVQELQNGFLDRSSTVPR
jgi:hypothetical protein